MSAPSPEERAERVADDALMCACPGHRAGAVAAIAAAIRDAERSARIEVAEAALAQSSRSKHHPYAFETAWRCMEVALGEDEARERMEQVSR